MMITRPQLAPGFYSVVVPDEDAALLLSEHETQLLRGRLYRAVVPRLDGRHTIPELIAQLQGQVSPPEVYYAVMRLAEQGYVVEAGVGVPVAWAAYWHVQHVDAHEATRRLRTSPVRVTACGAVAPEPLQAALTALTIPLSASGAFEVVVTEDYLHADLEVVNRRALTASRPWLLLKPVGTELWLGPLFRPGQTGCWACLAHRLRLNRPVQTWLQNLPERTPLRLPPQAVLPTSTQIAVHMAATAIAQWLVTGVHAALEGQVLTIEVSTLETRRHMLVRRPQCAECGDPAVSAKPLAPLVLQSHPKMFTTDGGHRHVAPAQTWTRYSHHISPITGVVPDLWRLSETDNAVAHIYAASNVFRPADSLAGVRSSLRKGNSGKGKTDEQARVSGLCEALERYCGLFQGDEPRLTARYRELGEAAIHPAACLLFSETQYRERHDSHAHNSGCNYVAEPFDDIQVIEWSSVWSLRDHAVKYVPTALGYYSYPLPPEHRFCRADSNGSAAGNTLEEATLQGFLELVERDSVALWWYNRVARPAVDLTDFDEPYFRAFTTYYEQQGREVWVLDLTSDLGIPVFAAVSRRTDQAGEQLIFGFGAHLDPPIGILRALTEMTQGLRYMATVKDVDAVKDKDSEMQDAQRWWQSATLVQHPYLASAPQAATKTAAAYPRLWSEDLREDVETCVAIAARHGLDTLLLDQTRPDIGLSVVKVIVPGLRHFWRRLAPGRLYEVPVRLGWLAAPLPEKQLNPVSMFF
jgi:ribosomal protein S12 methylthiotransferase accessory factor